MRNRIVFVIAAGCTATLIGAGPAVADTAPTLNSYATVAGTSAFAHQAFVEKTPGSGETASQRNASKMADQYLDYMAFSRSGLIDQLEYEGFSTADATYGVDSLNVDWNQQAVQSAKDYLDYTAFSRSGLIDQLMFEGFTAEQAEFGVSGAGL